MTLIKQNSPNVFNDETAIAVTLWLMTRYQLTGSKKVAHLVEKHLAWLGEYSDRPTLVKTYEKLRIEWRAISENGHSRVDYH